MCGRAGSRANALDWTSGRARWPPATSCASGSTTSRPASRGFRARYRDELVAHPELIDELRRRAASGRVTILYAARDREHNNAVVLTELLRDA